MSHSPWARWARRALLIGAAVAAPALIAASPAAASHLQGGFLSADVTADGVLRGTMTYLELNACPSGIGSLTSQQLQVTSPTGEIRSDVVQLRATRCIPGSSTYAGEFAIALDESSFARGAPDGVYRATFRSGNRLGGIVNLANSSSGYVSFTAAVRKVTGQATAAPFLGSDVATGISTRSAYSQNLNASDADGGTLRYETLLKPDDPDGPDSDVISLDQTGQVTIPAATTAAFTPGAYYIYKARVTDSQGDYAERDVLMRVARADAEAPVFHGISGEPYLVKPGQTTTIAFTASDPNAGDSVSISANGLPSWARLETTPGNPAQATLTLSPPADLKPANIGINLNALDDDATTPLLSSANVRIMIPAPAPAIASAPAAQAQTATFAFSGLPGATFECRVDGGAWTACASPFTPAGLADGAHTVEIRQTVDGVLSEAATHRWTRDTTAPAAPTLTVLSTGSRTARVVIAGEPGAQFSCRRGGGAWSPCASPLELDRLAPGEVLEVTQTDAAGNVSGIGRITLMSLTAPTPPRVIGTIETTVGGGSSSGARVNCAVTGATTRSCTVVVYATATVGGKATRVRIGSGRLTGKGAVVGVKLNKTGKRLAGRLGGVTATFKITATTGEGAVVRATRTAKLLPRRSIVLPSDGQFDVAQATLLPAGKRYLRKIAPQLQGAKRIVCVGNTDAQGSAAANKALGLARAKAVCRQLRRLGVKASLRSVSRGESRPRATNETAAGRKLNRRVELTVSYR